MLKSCFFTAALLATGRLPAAETNNAAQESFTRPLSLGECVDLALKQTSAILKGQSDLEASYGVHPANLLGFDLPQHVGEDIPLQLSGSLEAEPYVSELPAAIARALEKRPELGALRKARDLRLEDVALVRAGYWPSAQVFAGYGSRNSQFSSELNRDVSGWNAGVQVSWDIFDGFLSKGKVQQTQALHDKAKFDVEDAMRRIELEVRTAHSQFIEAKEVLESQKKVVEQADEALRLANARAEAGTGTQLDVLGAQTALTEARSTQVQALRDYAVARARLERATGDSAPRTVVQK